MWRRSLSRSVVLYAKRVDSRLSFESSKVYFEPKEGSRTIALANSSDKTESVFGALHSLYAWPCVLLTSHELVQKLW